MGASTSAVVSDVFLSCGLSDDAAEAGQCGLAMIGRDVDGDGTLKKRPNAARRQAAANAAVAAAASSEGVAVAASWLTPGLMCLSGGVETCAGDGSSTCRAPLYIDEDASNRECSPLHREGWVGDSCSSSGPKAAMATAAASERNASRAEEKANARERLEGHLQELFRLHDLNQDGVLDEMELIKLNEKISMLHHGKDTDMVAVRAKFRHLFRSRLDPDGKPVPFTTFRTYMLQVLDESDKDVRAQELMMEQFIVEAKSGRMAFHCKSFESVSDAQFRIGLDREFSDFARSLVAQTNSPAPSSVGSGTPSRSRKVPIQEASSILDDDLILGPIKEAQCSV